MKRTMYQTDNNIIISSLFSNKPTESIGSFLFRHLQIHTNKIAQVQVETGEEITYRQILERSVRLAIYLKSKICSDDIISVCSYNSHYATIPFIASQFMGFKIASLDPSLSTSEMTYLLNVVKPRIIFTIPESLQSIQDALTTNNLNTEIVVFGNSNKYENYFNMINEPISNEDNFKPVEIANLHQTAIIYFSSGTSGMPKGICLSHYAMILQTLKNSHIENMDLEYQKDCASRISLPLSSLSYTSMYWISSGQSLISAISNGVRQIMCRQFNAKQAWEIIVKYKPMILLLTPVYVFELMAVERPKLESLRSLLAVVIFGASIPLEKIQQFRAFLPDCDIYQGYGQTEVSTTITSFKANEKLHRQFIVAKPNSVGMPIHGMQCRVVDLETNTNLGPNQKGELQVRAESIMNGYYNMDSSKSFTDDGWLKTGDMLYYDEDFCFYFVDRLREGFKYRGWFIIPAVLESVLLQHDAVKYAAVIGIPKDDGEHAMGIVVLKEGFSNVSEIELEKFVEKKVSERQRLRAGVKIVDSFPISVTGKIKKKEIANFYRNVIY